MKKWILSFIILLPLVANADAVEIGGIYYNLINKSKQAEVTSNPTRYAGEITIPSIVTYENTNYSITAIGNDAFSYCSELTSVNIPDGVTSIGSNAFYTCSNLISVAIPNSVSYIGDYAFYGCSSLSSVIFPNNLNSIGNYSFDGCSNITSVTLPNGVTTIGNFVFAHCSELTSVTIPNSVTSIGNYAFSSDSKLNSIIIPNNVTSIEEGTFGGCSNLASVTLPDNLTTIGGNAFYGCICLTSIMIPNNVSTIGSSAFSGCTGLTSVIIPNNVSSIFSSTFFNCSSLASVFIPSSVTTIYYLAFRGCSSLTSVTIPNSVTSIGNNAFANCSNLTTVTIGNGIKTIGEEAFAQCPELTNVYCMAKELSSSNSDGTSLYTNSSAFINSFVESANLYVPTNSIEAYQAINPWCNFKEIRGLDEISISASNIRTYSSSYDLDFSGTTGLSAYIISEYNSTEGTLTLSPVTTVKSGEGLLLKGDAGEYIVPHTTTDATYTNYLVGVPTTTSVSPTDGDYTNFILANGSYGINFYLLSTTGDITGGKAYLKLPTSSLNARMRFSFTDDEVTAIDNNLVSEPIDNNIYDLQGRSVNHPTKGLYIINRKKVIIK